MTDLAAPDEHQLLIFWTQLLVLLFTARLLGHLMRRIGQPAVVGELGAGVVLGPSVLGRVAPDALEWLIPGDELQSGMLFAVAWIGILLLLIETGFETDLNLIRRLGRAVTLVGAGSVLVPLTAGLVVGAVLPDIFQGPLGDRTVFMLFVGAALSISSLAVAAKVLSELGLMRRNFGQVTLAAGMANDVVGWIMLGILVSLADAGELAPGPIAITVVGIAALFIGGLTLGQRAVDALLRSLRRRQAGLTGYLTAIILVSLVAGVATQLIGAEAVLGAFVAGIVIGRSRFEQPAVREGLEMFTAGVFAPIFFATAGLRVDLGLLSDSEVLRWAVVVVAAASIAKFAGAYAGSRLAGLHRREGVLLGLGLNPRGTLEIVIATVGLSLEVFNEASYTVIMLMAILNSMAAPPLLRIAARGWHGTQEEQERLQREEALARNLIVRTQRLLLPSQGGPNSIVAAQVMHLVWPEDVEATVLSVGDPDDAGVQAVVDVFADRPVVVQRVTAEDASAAILREAQLGYGAVGVGAPDAALGPWLLSPIVDELLTAIQVPLIIVRRARNLDRPLPPAFARAVVPVSATAASRTAQEIAFNLGARLGTELVLTHVLREREDDEEPPARFGRRLGMGGMDTLARHPRSDVALRVLEQAEQHADELGARHRRALREGAIAGEIVGLTRAEDADLLVLGANLRQLDDRPFLGHTVEQVLADCDCTVVVVATPSGPHG